MTRRRLVQIVSLLTLIFWSAPIVSADTYTWTAQGGPSWSSAFNWSGNVIPPSADTTDLLFDTAYFTLLNQDLSDPFVLHSITFAQDAFQINGGTLAFAGSAGGGPSIVQNSAQTQDLSLDLRLDVPTTIGGTGTGTVILRGVVTGTSLTASAPIDLENGGIKLAGSQAYTAALRFGSAVTLASTGAGAIALSGPVDGSSPLIVNTAGVTLLTGVIGQTTAPFNLATDAPGSTVIGAPAINTVSAQDYGDPVLLQAVSTILHTSTGNVEFKSSLDGPTNLTISAGKMTSFAAPVGGVTPLTRLVISGPGTVQLNGGLVRTTDSQFYSAAVTLGADTVLAVGSNGVLFGNAVDGAQKLTVTGGQATFNAPVGAVTPLASLSLEGATVNVPVTTLGGQTYAALHAGNAGTTLTSLASGDIVMQSVTAAGPLTINTAGVTRFVGSLHNLASVTTDAQGTTALEGIFYATGSFAFNDPVTLTGDTTLSPSGANVAIFAKPIDGDASFSFITGAQLTIAGPVGQTVPLRRFTATGASTGVQLAGGSVTTLMEQAFPRIVLQANTTLTSTGGGAISVAQAIGNFALSVNTAGATTLGVVGDTSSVASLTTDAPGSTTITGGTIRTTGAQAFNDPVTLGGAGTDFNFTSTGGGDIAFNGSLTAFGMRLAINTTGLTTLAGLPANGSGGAPDSITTDPSGATRLAGGTITTGGLQTYNDAVRVTAPTTLRATGVIFGGAVDGPGDLSLTITGSNPLILANNGPIGATTPLGSLIIDGARTTLGGGAVTTVGAQSYNGPVIVNRATTFTSTGGGNLSFASVPGDNTIYGLTFNTAGVTSFAAGGGQVASITTDAPGTTVLHGNINSFGAQTYNDAVILTGTMAVSSQANGGDITFGGSLNGAYDLTASTNQNCRVVFGGPVGDQTPIKSLSVYNATASINAGSMRATDRLYFYGPATLGAPATLTLSSTSGAVQFSQKLDGAFPLVIDSAGGGQLLGNVGSTTPLLSLTTSAGGSTTLGASTSPGGALSILTTGPQTYNDAVFLGANVTLTSVTGDVTFALPVQAGSSTLAINAAGKITMAGMASSTGMLQISSGGDSTITGVFFGQAGLAKAGNGMLTLPAANTYTGPTEITAGRLRVSGSISGSSGVHTAAAATFEAAAAQQVRSLTIDPTGQATVSVGTLKVGNGTSATPLTIAASPTGAGTGGKLDLVAQAIVVQPTSAAKGDTLDTVRSLITTGFNGGHWDGGGIISSTAGTDARRAIGYALAVEVRDFPPGGQSQFLGQSVDDASVVARVTLAGDANLDGAVDFKDLVALAQNYNTPAPAPGSGQSAWVHGDFNYDGTVDFSDLVRLAQNYNTNLTSAVPAIETAQPNFNADVAAAFANVPEPSALAVIGLVAIGLSLPRRPRRIRKP